MMFSVIFCLKCGSQKVDVFSWLNPATAQIRCCNCGHEANLTGFTLGRVIGAKATAEALAEASEDRAIKSTR